jgi:hypothetical protein
LTIFADSHFEVGQEHHHPEQFAGFFRGQKFSQRIPQDQAAQVEQDVENYRRFQQLAEDFVTVSDQITRLQDQQPDSKKNSSPRRSPTSSSRKPRPS